MSINKTVLAGLLVSCFALASVVSTSADARGGTGGNGGTGGKLGRSDGSGAQSNSDSGCSGCGHGHSNSHSYNGYGKGYNNEVRSFSHHSKKSCPPAVAKGNGANPERSHGGDLMRKQNDVDIR